MNFNHKDIFLFIKAKLTKSHAGKLKKGARKF